MKVLIPNHEYDYPEDIRRIQKAFANKDFLVSKTTAEFIWLEYSDSMAAGWLCLPESDDEIVASALPYLKYEEENEND